MEMEVRGGRTGAEPSSPPAGAVEAAARWGSREEEGDGGEGGRGSAARRARRGSAR